VCRGMEELEAKVSMNKRIRRIGECAGTVTSPDTSHIARNCRAS
jgi:hypothetical protein